MQIKTLMRYFPGGPAVQQLKIPHAAMKTPHAATKIPHAATKDPAQPNK